MSKARIWKGRKRTLNFLFVKLTVKQSNQKGMVFPRKSAGIPSLPFQVCDAISKSVALKGRRKR